ncbi:FAD binding domain protein [Zopfia rhizophila CBS 207.26]|uniref:FAD binding domain protein n=1 Tax=Zopfia rhizophila CBS 207.26 TaxID=1314779 RepID=A0A6A6EPT4_9PEZI|nr:FAD binding domain protein [Zopfia rhizophila CBS 207.26]
MDPVKKVIIIGAGPAGVGAALNLRKTDHIFSTIYEIRPVRTTLGGAVGIPSNGLRLLDRLGLYDEVLARGVDTSTLILHSIKGHVMGQMDMGSWSKEKTGFGYLRIQRTDLMDVLLDAAEKADIPIHYGQKLVKIDEDDNGVTATFSDGTKDTGDFLLGCDGIHSAVRTLYVDPTTEPQYSGISNIGSDTSLGSVISTSGLPLAAASLKGLNATLTTDGLFAVTPCTPAQDMLYWFFSREVAIPESGDTRDGWEERGKKEIEGMKSTMLDVLGDAKAEWVDMLRELVRQTDVVKFYPNFRLPPGAKWSRGRCLLIGDAAHAMPPHASQGVSMALEDIFLLCRLLHDGSRSLENVVRTYEEKRGPRAEEMLRTALRNGSVRKKMGPWRHRFNEVMMTGGLHLYNMLDLDRLGLGKKPLAYDIDEEQI